jgi:hydrogenase maturation protein HypF
MARNLETIMTFAKVSKEEEQLLKSYARPIILLDKSKSYCLSDLIAPGLHNIGVMLPYTGLHHMLFDAVDDAAFVMTSANPPNQPIVKDNEEALKTLGNAVDYFLFHDRQIAHRCDDSVLRMHGKRQLFIRRSRGYAPTPIILREKTRRCIVGLGGELNDTSCILLENKAFVSPHIGDVENIETESFLRNTIEYLTRLTNSKIEAVACDLHPKFTTTKLAHQLAEENNWQLVQVQHHHAHIAALMAEHNIKEMMGICCDGYGYGTDGEAWGGEILLCTEETEGFKRLAHLEKQPLAGGDLATRYPLRVAAGILSKRMKIEDWLLENAQRFPYGKEETLILVDQLRKGFGVSETTSCGRVLDAIAAILGICYERTYEGEPAMKLESAAIDGKDVLSLEPTIENGILETTQMVYEVFVNREKYSKTDLAYSAHAYLARGLATLAIENVVKNDVKAIGFSGGAACNGILASIMRKTVKDAGLQFVVHSAVPPGDGGVSFGQAVVGGFLRH